MTIITQHCIHPTIYKTYDPIETLYFAYTQQQEYTQVYIKRLNFYRLKRHFGNNNRNCTYFKFMESFLHAPFLCYCIWRTFSLNDTFVAETLRVCHLVIIISQSWPWVRFPSRQHQQNTFVVQLKPTFNTFCLLHSSSFQPISVWS